jgi:hypothetical protein
MADTPEADPNRTAKAAGKVSEALEKSARSLK